MRTRHIRGRSRGSSSVTAGPDEYRELEGLPDKTMMLCKFKGTLTAAQMRDDLVFQAASDNTPYRETKWIW